MKRSPSSSRDLGRPLLALCAALALGTAACGSKSGLGERRRIDAGGVDASMDARAVDAARDAPDTGSDAGTDSGQDAPSDVGMDVPVDAFMPDAGRDAPFDAGCLPIDDRCGASETCGNGLDDDCNGAVDENCGCEPGAVQSCFVGPPGRRGVGACRDGEQVCESSPDGRGQWGACTGGIGPSPDVCDGQDNLCNGCSFDRDCPIDCPSPDDPRTPTGTPFEAYPLRVRDFYPGRFSAVLWEIEGGPCDRLATRLESFELSNPTGEVAIFTPRLSGEYTVTLTVITVEGTRLSCEWVVHVEGPGLRIEMCYPESETMDLDLALGHPRRRTPWYPRFGTAFEITNTACSWLNCQAQTRGGERPMWGYASSPLSECENGPQGAAWAMLGFCANPRLDIDNNLDMSIGMPENINVDVPEDGDVFRIMVENFTGTPAHPVVNVYCDGRRIATYGADPDPVLGFEGPNGGVSFGAMWRVADVRISRDPGGTLRCESTALHPPGTETGYDVSVDDPRY